jgi:protein TonB
MDPNKLVTPTVIPEKIPPPSTANAGAGEGGVEGGVEGGIEGGVLGGVLGSATTAKQTILPMGSTAPLKVLRQVNPTYPPAALAMGLQGRVTVELIVDENGDVINARVLKSDNAIFNEAALEAVRKWQFTKPTAQGGQAVKVFWIVNVDFKTR